MKRFFSIIAVAMALVATSVALSSCKKEETKKQDALAGTCWAVTVDYDVIKTTVEIYFLEDNRVKSVMTATVMGETQTDTVFGTYTYSAPTVTLTMATEQGTQTDTGTISGSTLTLSDGTTFTKK